MSRAERIAFVTGANRGIGLEISRQLAREGVHVVLGSRDAAAGEEAARALVGEGLSASSRVLDVCDRDSIARMVAALKADHGDLDILIHNAGIALDGFDAEVARRTIETNFTGPRLLGDAALPILAKGARIVMVSSGMGDRSALSPELRKRFEAPMSRSELIALMQKFIDDVAAGVHAREGWPTSAYRVSKIGLNKLTEISAMELADDPRRILVNAADPGWVRTRMGGKSAPRSVEQGARTPAWLALEGDGSSGGVFCDEERVGW